MIFGSVCSGIEAASVAWAPLGWRAAFLSEIEAFPRAVLKHHYPEVPLHGDFTTIQVEYEPIDLLVGGTPCQSFSVAGLRGGLDDDRGNLALEYLRLADRLRPRWLVWENVPGVLSSAGGRDFGAILGGMVELGYGVAYRVLDAQHFGVPQRRRRVFVVGYLGDWRRAAAVLFERHSLSGHSPPRREARAIIAASLTGSLGRRGGQPGGGDTEGHLIAGTLNASGKAAGSATQQDAESGLLIAHSLRGEGFDASEDGTGRGTPLVPVYMPEVVDPILARSSRGGGQTNSPGHNADQQIIAFSSKDHGADAESDLAPTLRAGGHSNSHANAGVPPAIAFQPRVSRNGRGGASEVVPALNGADAGATSDMRPCVATASAVRRLTPRECERLQGFHDDYTLIPWRKGMASDGPRYKALGNSMAVPVMSWIGQRIQMVEGLA